MDDTLLTLSGVKQDDVLRIVNEVRVTKVVEDQDYALYVPGTANAASA